MPGVCELEDCCSNLPRNANLIWFDAVREQDKPWYLRTSKRWMNIRRVPFRRLWVLLIAVFLMFFILGFYQDLEQNGELPYVFVLAICVYSGLNAVLWFMVSVRLPIPFIGGLIVLQFFNSAIMRATGRWLERTFHLQAVAPVDGIDFSASGMVLSCILSYSFFLAYIRREGRESSLIESKLELAHGIQKTLVPLVHLRTAAFEIYGESLPSEKVGGDLVDAILLPGGDAVTYLADIAGHGLPAGILMGMLKTAVRTALLDAGEPEQTMPVLLDRLNTVLPQVKEPQMYATFTGFRLAVDGSVFYALAASPPILHWHAAGGDLSDLQEQELPLGLLPVSGADGHFVGRTLIALPGDLLVVATDGILEVCRKDKEEFGVARLQAAIEANAQKTPRELAAAILGAARQFGVQADDQTILIVRRL